jgi:hypothetical protein
VKRRIVAARRPLGLILALALAPALAAPTISTAQASDFPVYSSLFGELLEQYTKAVPGKLGTRVDYPGLLKEARWKQLVGQLASVDPAALETRSQRLAFWINAYNILAIDLVLGRYPVASIRDIGSFFSPVWKAEAGRIGGKARSLAEIEHEILRPLGEPRIHAAIVCASVSCPDLRREPFEPARIEAQLDDQLRVWLANPQKGSRIDRASGTLTLSPLFKWFAEDFEGRGGVLEAIGPYLPEASRRWIANRPGEPEVAYFDYDWSLNE